MRARMYGLVLVLLCALLPGCGARGAKPGAHLAGEVTIGSRPLPDDADAAILFIPVAPAGRTSPVSAPIVRGRYVARHVPLGRVTVMFRVSRPTGRLLDGYSGGLPEYENLVPEKYMGGLPLDVIEDNPHQDFQL